MAERLWRKPLDAGDHKPPRGRIHVIGERCKGCGFCIEFCPQGVLAPSKEFNAKGYHPPYAKNEEACVACGLCEMICPDFAIFVTEDPEGRLPDSSPHTRNISSGVLPTGQGEGL